MIEIRLLGTARLHGRDGREARAVLAQPRRFALLAWLALRGAERRDTLLGVFWPESGTSHARAALRNALHFLRSRLGSDAIESVGDEEIRIPADAVWCDVGAFERALDEGRTEEALDLYRGDLLAGFYVSDAPEFERRIGEERDRLHRRALEGLARLSEEAEAAGHLGLAEHHARRALALEPDDEPTVRRLVALQWRAGDRAGAIGEYEEFTARLEEEYGLEPAEETTALLKGLLEAEAGREPAATGAAEEPAEDGASGTPPVPPREFTRRASGPARTRRRGRAWAGLGALAVVALLVARPGPEPGPAASADVVAVLPFSYTGSDELGYLGDGMVTLLTASLDGAGPLRAVDARTAFERVARGSSAAGRPEAAREVARRVGAGAFVVGDLVETGGRIRVGASMVRTDGGGPPPPRIEIEGDAEAMFDLVDVLAARLLEGRAASEIARVATRTTVSNEALKRFLRGEAEYRSGRYREAVEDLRAAVEIDSTFALAQYRLSTAAIWVGHVRLSRAAARRAQEHSGRLSGGDSLLVAAWYHHVEGRMDLAEPLYRRVIDLEPGDVEPWFQLGDLLFHWGPVYGRPVEESRVVFERVIEIEPDHASALVHLVRLAALEGRRDDLERWVDRLEELGPDSSWALEAGILRDVVGGEAARRREAIRRAAAAAAPALGTITVSVAVYAQDLDAAIALARAAIAGGSSGREIRARILWAELEMARGRRGAALAALEGLPEPRALEFRAALAALPYLPAPDPAAGRFRAALREPSLSPPLPPPDHPVWLGGGEYPPLAWDGIHSPRRHYLLGALAVGAGDDGEVEAAIDDLEGLGLALSGYYATLLRARVAARRGTGADGLRALGATRTWKSFETLVDYARADERFLRAGFLAEAGRPEEAARWYASFPSPTGHDLMYLGPARLGRARALAAAGDEVAARREYRRFVVLWSKADPELRPLVRQALAEMGRLGGS